MILVNLNRNKFYWMALVAHNINVKTSKQIQEKSRSQEKLRAKNTAEVMSEKQSG